MHLCNMQDYFWLPSRVKLQFVHIIYTPLLCYEAIVGPIFGTLQATIAVMTARGFVTDNSKHVTDRQRC